MNLAKLTLFFVVVNLCIFTYFSWQHQQYSVVINELDQRQRSLQANVTATKLEIEKQTREYKHTRQYLENNFIKIKDVFAYTRRNLIRIKGVPETKDEDVHEKVLELIEYVGFSVSPKEIVRANRIGEKKTQDRLIVAELLRYKLKIELLKKAAIALMFSNVVIQDDATSYILPASLLRPAGLKMAFDCKPIESIGAETTNARSRVMFGSWMHDTMATENTTWGDSIWVLPNYYDNNIVEEYANIRELTHRRARTTYKLPYQWAGTGHVVYNHSIYFSVFNSNMLVRYCFLTRTIVTTRNLTGATFGNVGAYQWSGSTDIDFSVDELGMWVIYATIENSLDTVITQLNPYTLEDIETWRTNWRKQWCGNAFMACGILYTLKKYDEIDTSLGYTYDTSKNVSKHIQIPITNKYEWNTMLTYSPRDKKLYGWDRGYLVTYGVKFSE